MNYKIGYINRTVSSYSDDRIFEKGTQVYILAKIKNLTCKTRIGLIVLFNDKTTHVIDMSLIDFDDGITLIELNDSTDRKVV
jgi:hypothetical protein